MPLSKSARLSGSANFSVDFMDSRHLLITFNPKKLFKRSPNCPPTHDDRLIHAAVFDVPTAKVVKQTDWYLHDSRRYLWPVGAGRVLLRKGNQLFLVDTDFSEKQILGSKKDLVWVSVTPDGKQVIAETDEESNSKTGRDAKAVKARISFLNTDTLEVERVINAKSVIKMEAASSGFADLRGGDIWVIRFGAGAKDRFNIARVKSHRPPAVLYTSANTMLLGRCTYAFDGFSVSVFAVDGRRLWGHRRSDCRYSPVTRTSEEGGRFVLSTVTLRPGVANEPEDTDHEEDGLDQNLEILDTATGKSVASFKAPIPIMDAENVALSPDGGLVAVLVGTSVEIRPLPAMTAEDREKYAVIKPLGPPVPPAPAGSQTTESEEIVISAAEQPSPSPSEQNTSATATEGTSKPAPANDKATSATTPATTDASPVTFRTGTQVVALDVVVTDSKGKVVEGLQASDFSVAEDSKPQAIRYFQENAGAKPAEVPATPQPQTPLPPNIYSNLTQPSDPGATTVVLLDILNTPLPDQMRARAELIQFIKSKPASTQIALFILGTRLQMIQGFTHDGNLLLTAATSKKASLGQRALMESDAVAETTIEAGAATARLLPQLNFFVASFKLQQSEVQAYEADRRMTVTVGAFAQLARYLSGIPGRKNLIWLSGSFQLGIYPDSSGQAPFVQARNYSDNLRRVANLLGDAHVAVYPVNVKGLVTDPLFTAETNDTLAPLSMQSSTPIGMLPGGRLQFAGSDGGRSVRSANTAVPIAVMQDANEQFALSQAGERATMDQLAAQTGGRAFFNTNGISQAIASAADQGSNYYALSYTPSNKLYNGAFRKIKVNLPGKKYHLSYRTGYYAVDPYAPAKASKDLASGLALAAMQQGSPQSRQVVFAARVVPLGKPTEIKNATPAASNSKKKANVLSGKIQKYGIDYAVTPSELRFSQMPDGTYHDVMNFMITAFDEDGNLIRSQVSQLIADLKPEIFRTVLQSGVRLHQEVDVPLSGTVMRLGVEDLANSHIGTMELSLPVPVPPESPAYSRSLPPLEPD